MTKRPVHCCINSLLGAIVGGLCKAEVMKHMCGTGRCPLCKETVMFVSQRSAAVYGDEARVGVMVEYHPKAPFTPRSHECQQDSADMLVVISAESSVAL
jgi:hypothetical protein